MLMVRTTLHGAALAALQTFDGTSYKIITNQNVNPGQWFYPFGQKAQGFRQVHEEDSGPIAGWLVEWPNCRVPTRPQIFGKAADRIAPFPGRWLR